MNTETGSTQRHPPRGFSRLLYRLPIWFYRWHLGWLLGGRFLLLNHVGRKSGRPRQAVVEVAGYDKATDIYLVAAGFGPKSDWYRNVVKTPDVTIQVGRRRLAVTAVPLSPQESGQAMVDYAHRHPGAARTLARVLGFVVTGSDDEYRRLAEQHIPFVAFRPRAQAKL
ncbi:MAG: nitroreductase family deazaflavin-dependent oxidoreductase [Ardenticatenales bacterium]|nr:nitroreductase family deazaflavin-dependent oxidoreductase [Ardenticatenales bacterium]